jgi:heme-degrading monooxygenase HmoA
MSYVAINVLTVPEGDGATLEARFAGRAGSVDSSPGFERFELLRPVEGTDTYLVYTRWRSKEDFENWTASQAFARGHARTGGATAETGGTGGAHGTCGTGGAQGARPAATGSTVWGFEVAQASPA